jgi:hypothetical protein
MLEASKPAFEYNQYVEGKQYCRQYDIFLYRNGLFCPCCGVQLRLPSTGKNGEERLRLIQSK